MQFVTNIFSNLVLIQANGADKIAFCPKMSAPIAPLEFKMKIEYLYGAFTL
jgi:hypothetical protein